MSAPIQIKLIDFCRQHQIPYFYMNIKYITTPDGKQKKQISRLPKGYMTMDFVTAMSQPIPPMPTHINIILRNSAITKLAVIDTDSESAYQTITTNPQLCNTAVTNNKSRPGHAHFYYEVSNLPPKKIIKTANKQDIDLIIDNIFESLDAFFEIMPIHVELKEITSIFGQDKQITVNKNKSKNKDNNIEPYNITPGNTIDIPLTAKAHTPNNIESEQTDELPTTEQPQKQSVSIELIEKIINGLQPSEFESYQMWIKICYCLYNLAELDAANKYKYFGILNNFLKKCRNYNEAENLKFFFDTQVRDGPNKITIKTLYYWLKQQNHQLYDELFAVKDKVNGDNIDPMHFYNKYKTNYLAAKEYFEQVYFKLNNPACYCQYNNLTDTYSFLTEKDMLHITSNFWINDPENTQKRVKFFNCWRDDPAIKYYSTMKLVPPPLVCDARTLNLFTGFVADKLADTTTNTADITHILNHITLLCEDNPVYAEYVINFLAHIVQRPAELTRTALVFKGSQGAGKGLLFNWFANKIIGQQYYYSTADPLNITLYNEHLNGKLLINLDEARAADTYASSSQLKNKITEPRITLTNKYVKPFEVENYGRYIFFSNQDNPVKIEDTDRRYVVFKTSDKYSRLTDDDPIKINYFRDLRNAMNNPNIVGSFMKYLKDRDVTGVNWANRPMTESYKLSRELNIPIFAEFIEKYCFETNGIIFTNNITQTTKSQLFTEFNKFLDRPRNTGLTMKERTFYVECKKYSFIISKQNFDIGARYIEINRTLAFEYLKANRYLQNLSEEYIL